MLLSTRIRCLLLAVLAAALALPAGAAASDPIMALGDVHAGAHCTSLTVVHGTAITSFDVEILDVMLATPIERILAVPVLAPWSASRSLAPAPAPIVGSHGLAGPLTLSGVSPAVATMFARASRKAGHPLVTSVASGGVGYLPQPLVPGAAVSVGMTSGDVSLGAIGTVAYADGGDVWLFGHSLDGAGRRSQFLEDAYIETVINNPIGAPELSTYKLGTPGQTSGR